MLISVMRVLFYIYAWTWFIWPFVFIFNFANGLSRMIKDAEGFNSSLFVSAISLLVILSGILYPHLG